MHHTRIVPSLAALSLIAAAFTPQTRGQVASPPAPPAAQPAVAPAAAPPAPFTVVTELAKDILPMIHDSKGTYWFGSRTQGLYRWDGVKGKTSDANTFAHFTTDSGLCHNVIGAIQGDKAGNLYFSTGNGISKFDGRVFTTLKLDESEPAVTEVKLGPDILWFGGGGEKPHIIFYDGTRLRKLKMPTTAAGDAHYASLPRDKFPNAKYSPYDVGPIYTDRRGCVWFGTASLGACRFDGRTFAWISQEELAFNEKNQQNFSTRSIIEDKDGKFWITCTRHRFDMYPTGKATPPENATGLRYVKEPGLAHNASADEEHFTFMMSMVKDQAGDLWMATYGAGVWRYDGKTLKHYPVMVDGKPGTVVSIYRDREDGLWLGSPEYGLCKFNGRAFEKVKF